MVLPIIKNILDSLQSMEREERIKMLMGEGTLPDKDMEVLNKIVDFLRNEEVYWKGMR